MISVINNDTILYQDGDNIKLSLGVNLCVSVISYSVAKYSQHILCVAVTTMEYKMLSITCVIWKTEKLIQSLLQHLLSHDY